jgi:hypothetical protein
MATLKRTMAQAMDQEAGYQDAGASCPAPTQDITLNLKNRGKAITSANYGPENPNLPNTAFWREKADEWDVSVDEAKQSRCGNCAAFNVSDKIKQCIADGIGNEADPWGTIKLADLGYCEIFDFKCAASRTCDAWVVGGPNKGEGESDGGSGGEDDGEDMPESLLTIKIGGNNGD